MGRKLSKLTFIVVLLSLGGCKSTDILNYQNQTLSNRIHDLPMVTKSEFVEGQSYVSGAEDVWTGRLVIISAHDREQMVEFYRKEMPGFGWQLSKTRYHGELYFRRGARGSYVSVKYATGYSSKATQVTIEVVAGNATRTSDRYPHIKYNDVQGKGNKPTSPEVTRIIPKEPPPPEVARVIPKEPAPKPPIQSGSSGSGFFVSKMGHVVTNAHVVNGCQRVTVGDNANTQTPAEVVFSDARNDLALLKLSSLDMASSETRALVRKLEIKIVPLASDGLLRSDDVELGEKVLVAGYPYGDIFSNTIKVTGGMVSATRGMGDDTGQFQLDAAVQPGNSGGPIYDDRGNVVGVVVSQLNKLNVAKAIGSMPENVNFGIKASTVRQFLTASGLPSKWSERSKVMSNKELAKVAQNQALMVVCY